MWKVDFDSVKWRKGILIYDGDPYETCMVVGSDNKLLIGLKCLEYFAYYGVPYNDLEILYRILKDLQYDTLQRRLYNSMEDPMDMVLNILRENEP